MGRSRDQAFILVEVLIVLIIIAILAAIILLAGVPSVESSKAKVCAGNKEVIKTAYSLHRFDNGGNQSLIDFLKDGTFRSYIDNDQSRCPSGGTYYASGDAEGRTSVYCSVHDAETSGGGGPVTGGIITGTDVPASDKWENAIKHHDDPYNNYWTITLNKGEKFYYDGRYYVAVSDVEAEYRGDGEPAPDMKEWWTTANNEGLVEVTGVNKDWTTEVKNGDSFKRGDIVYFEGHYYICQQSEISVIIGKYYSTTPLTRPDSWFKLSS